MSTQLATTSGVAAPTSLDEIMRLGKVLAASGFFKETSNEAEAVAKILVGMEMGIAPTAALRSVQIFNGQIGLHYSLIGSLIKQSGKYDYQVIDRTPTRCTVEFFENGKKVGTVTKTRREMDDRKVSMSWDKTSRSWKTKFVWDAYPDTMLFARCLTDGQRTYCPDVGNGPLYTPEELGDDAVAIEEEGVDVSIEQPAQLPAPVDEQSTNGNGNGDFNPQPYIDRINELRAQIITLDPNHLFVVKDETMTRLGKAALTNLGKSTAAKLEDLQAAADPQMQQIDELFPAEQPKFQEGA